MYFLRCSYDRRGRNEGGRKGGRRKGKEREYDREGQRREREGVETGRGGIGREGKDAYAESSSARRATFIGAWMYDDDMLPAICVTSVSYFNVHIVPCDWLWKYIKEGACVSASSSYT